MNGNLTNDEKPDRFALGHGHRRDAVYAPESREGLGRVSVVINLWDSPSRSHLIR